MIRVLVALGLLLCAGKESQAKQPARAPEPAGPDPSAPGRPRVGGRVECRPASAWGKGQDLVLWRLIT